MLRFHIASDIDYDNVVCEINDDTSFLCLLSKEEGDKQVMIEFAIELSGISAYGTEFGC